MSLSIIDFTRVKNRNEKKVLKILEDIISSEKESARINLLTEKDWQDIYALALNHLPARYAQPGTIVVGEPVRDEDTRSAVMDALDVVFNRPKD